MCTKSYKKCCIIQLLLIYYYDLSNTVTFNYIFICTYFIYLFIYMSKYIIYQNKTCVIIYL